MYSHSIWYLPLCKCLPSTLVESGLQPAQSALNHCTVQMFTESEDTRWCVNTIFPPEDGYVNARNMSRIIMYEGKSENKVPYFTATK